jgi:hypothetical protein
VKQLVKRVWAQDRSKLPLKWWFAPLIAVLAVFVAGVGVLHGDEIKVSTPFKWATAEIAWYALLFWGGLIACASLLGKMLSARNEATSTAVAELKERSAELQGRVHSLPPRGFLVTFEDLFRVSFDVDSRAGESEDGLKASIVVALGGIASMVRAFSSRSDGAEYFINLMVFRPAAQIRPEDLSKHVLFAEPGANANTWDGVLQLRKEFAYRFDHDNMQPDTEVEPIMLAIPEPDYRMDGGKPTLLPGAPAVFCDPTQSAGFENTLELAAWCREHLALRSSVADDIERYYAAGAGKNIRSFICMPIVVTPPGGTPITIGVLNIQSSRAGFLPGEQAGHFIPLATPFVLLIGRSLSKYRVVPKAVPTSIPRATTTANATA